MNCLTHGIYCYSVKFHKKLQVFSSLSFENIPYTIYLYLSPLPLPPPPILKQTVPHLTWWWENIATLK